MLIKRWLKSLWKDPQFRFAVVEVFLMTAFVYFVACRLPDPWNLLSFVPMAMLIGWFYPIIVSIHFTVDETHITLYWNKTRKRKSRTPPSRGNPRSIHGPPSPKALEP